MSAASGTRRLLAGALLLAPGCALEACSEPDGSGSGGAAATGATGTGAAAAGGVGSSSSASSTGASGGADAGPPQCEPEPIPAVVPEGWVEYTDWSCDCRFYVPPSKDLLPPPIAWKPCPEAPGGIQCQAMVTDWDDSTSPIGSEPKLSHNPDGSAVLEMVRGVYKQWNMYAIGDADGPMRFAFVQPMHGKSWLGCRFHSEHLAEGMHVVQLRGHKTQGNESKHYGAIGGPIDELRPRLLDREINEDNPWDNHWECTSKWLFKYTWPMVQTAHPWDMSQQIFVTSSETDPEHDTVGDTVASGDALFWSTGTLKRRGINVWDPVAGARLFQRWVGDYTKGAADLGADGVDLVWAYGEGKQPDDWTYPIQSIMTAPFTTDPQALKARRLRSYPGTIGTRPFEVACGYAANDGIYDDKMRVMVVRLSDGQAWFLPITEKLWPVHAIGLTCEELFAVGDVEKKTTIIRIRLDSLGPGVPPD
ncbi:MAG: hypothetical protein HY744_32080 [Deltaproteobacteria bacterium]|nr:hypothetical protein [Deltaproteobacteria bacterium]